MPNNLILTSHTNSTNMNIKKLIFALAAIIWIGAGFNPASSQTLWDAVQAGDLDQASSLLQNNADPNQVDANGVSPLFMACEKANADMVDLLLDNAANPNLTNADSSTPLIIAAKLGLINIVETLLNHAADPDYLDNDKMRAFDYAAESKVPAGLNGTTVVDPTAVFGRLYLEISN